MKIEIRPHPAQARHPITQEPLFYEDTGHPVPLFKDQKAIYLDGKMVGYCGAEPGKPLTMTQRLPPAVLDEVSKFVTEKVGAPKSVRSPPRQDLVAEAEREIQVNEFEEEDDDG